MDERVWVVASEDMAAQWCDALSGHGYRATALAWSHVHAVEADRALRRALVLGRPDRVLLTSRYAVRHRPAALPADLACACVGEATAEAARAAGLDVREVGPGTGERLAQQLLEASPPIDHVLFLRGRHIRREGVQRLEQGGVEVAEVVVYEARPRDDFSGALRRAEAPDALVAGSPRAARALAAGLVASGRSDRLELPVVAPGAPTADALAEAGFTMIETAPAPSPAGLAAGLAAFFGEGPSREA